MPPGLGLDDAPDVRSWTFAGPVERSYELSKAPVNMIVGPTGGGKTTGSARRCLRVAAWQDPSPRDGVRRARIVVICPTYRRAWDTVMPSYFKVFRQSMGEFRGSRGDPADHTFDAVLNIAGSASRIHVEVLFRAVNDLDIEDFFRGFEFTAAWLPEADTNADLDAILSFGANRAGRYPEPEDRPDHSEVSPFKGLWGDANAPLIGTPFHRRFYMRTMPTGKPAPTTDRLWVQPGGRSASAENMANLRKLDPNYYGAMALQLDSYDERRLIDNRPGYGRHGQPVHPNFDDQLHVAAQEIAVDRFCDLVISVDCGSGSMIPGATIEQRLYSGQWTFLDEIHLREGQMSTQELGGRLRQWAELPRFSKARGCMICVDPAANSRSPQTEFTDAQALGTYAGIEVQLAPTNVPKYRRQALDKLFLARVPGNPREPMILIDPACQGLIEGLAGAWHYPRRAGLVSPTPDKGRWSHVCEAAEYGPLTVDGIDAHEGRLIRPAFEGDQDTVSCVLPGA